MSQTTETHTVDRTSVRDAARKLLEALDKCVIEGFPIEIARVYSRCNYLRAVLADDEKWMSNHVTLTGQELLDAVEFIDFDPECEVGIGWFEACESEDSARETMQAGYYVWMTEYPEEGRVLLGPDDAARQEPKNES